MSGKVRLVVGPAAAGKTTKLLDRYRAALSDSAWGDCAWIAPTRRTAGDVLRALPTSEATAIFEPGVTTFAELAERIVRTSSANPRRLGRLAARRVLRRAIDSAGAAGELGPLAAISESAGLLNQVEAWVRRLKRHEIWPEHFDEATRGAAPKQRALLAIYRRYQDLLAEHEWYDAEGVYWLARTLLRDERPAEVRYRVVVADGFSDFTRTQIEILELLADDAEEVWISLPGDDRPGREEVFSKPQATEHALRKRFPDLRLEQCAPVAGALPPGIASLAARVFRDDDGDPPPVCKEVVLTAAPTALREIELIAREVKRLLVEGDQGRAVSPDDCVVVFRALDAAADIRAAMKEFGVPYSLETPRPLLEEPAVGALLAALAVVRQDWAYRPLAAWMGNGLFQPPELDPEALGDARGAAQRLLRRLQWRHGRRGLIELVTAEAWRYGDESDPDGRTVNPGSTPALAAKAEPLLRSLAAAEESLPEVASLSEWTQAWRRYAQQLGIVPADRSDASAVRDAIVLDRLWSVLEAAAEFERAEDELTFEQAVSVLRDAASEPASTVHDETGRVRILSAQNARTLSAPYLFVGNLNERAFPAAGADDSLGNRGEVRALSAALAREGLTISGLDNAAGDEMLLFYETATRARRKLYMSYAAFDSKAEPVNASPFVADVARALGAALQTQEIADLIDVGAGDSPLSPREARRQAVQAAVHGDGPRFKQLASAAGPTTASRLVASQGAIVERSRRDEWGVFEGVLDAAPQRTLAERFGPSHEWSATALEQYGRCPFQFFAEQVLRLEVLEERRLEEDRRTRGSLMHEVLARTLATFIKQGRLASGEHPEPTEFYRVLHTQLQQTYENRRPTSGWGAATAELDRRAAVDWIARFSDAHHAYFTKQAGAFVPLHVEFGFGSGRADPDEATSDERGRPPFVLETDLGPIRLAGRIDRIDVNEARGRFKVIDYKTGSTTPAKGTAEVGRHLQLRLYSLVAEHFLELEVEEAAYWKLSYSDRKKNDHGYQACDVAERNAESEAEEEVRDADGWRSVLAGYVGTLVAGVRAGQFPASCADEQCGTYCDFAETCRVRQIRSLGKQWP